MPPDLAPPELPAVFRTLDVMGVVLNGIIGGTIARQRRFDLIGFVVLALLSALGGGALRDVLLDSGRPVFLTDPFYLGGALAGAAVAYVLNLRGRLWRWLFPWADAAVLGVWAVTGAVKSLNSGLGWMPSILLGVMTAVGGGMIRDIVAGNVPEIFGGRPLYAAPAMLAAAATVLGLTAGWPPNTVMLCAAVLGASVVLLARWRNWQIPVHGDGTVTMTKAQLAQLIRRVERFGRGRGGATRYERGGSDGDGTSERSS